MAKRVLRLRVVSHEKAVFEGEASALVAPAWDGKIGILRGHAPLITLLGSGELIIDLPGGGSQTFHVAGGVMKVDDDDVTVLTEYAGTEPPSELSVSSVLHPEDVLAGSVGKSLA